MDVYIPKIDRINLLGKSAFIECNNLEIITVGSDDVANKLKNRLRKICPKVNIVVE